MNLFRNDVALVQQGTSVIQITPSDKFGVFAWRKLLVPFFETIGGASYPPNKVREFAYGDLPGETLDYLAKSQPSAGNVAIVHIHGGGWVAGSKGRFYAKPLLKFSEAGYPVFSLNYPLAPDQQHPQILRSVLNALAWIKQQYPQYDAIHLIGDSAGGNLAMMSGIYVSNPDLLKKISALDPSAFPRIKTVVDLYGVNDRTSWITDGFPGAKLFSKAYLARTATPEIPIVPMDFDQINTLPQTFIVGAGKDALLRSSKIWVAHICKQFNSVEFKVYEGADHGFFSFGTKSDELQQDILNFFARHAL